MYTPNLLILRINTRACAKHSVCVFERGTAIIEEILPEKERPDLGMV